MKSFLGRCVYLALSRFSSVCHWRSHRFVNVTYSPASPHILFSFYQPISRGLSPGLFSFTNRVYRGP